MPAPAPPPPPAQPPTPAVVLSSVQRRAEEAIAKFLTAAAAAPDPPPPAQGQPPAPPPPGTGIGGDARLLIGLCGSLALLESLEGVASANFIFQCVPPLCKVLQKAAREVANMAPPGNAASRRGGSAASASAVRSGRSRRWLTLAGT